MPSSQRHRGAWKPRFLAAIAAGQQVKIACQLAGVSRQAVYALATRDPVFAYAWKQATVAADQTAVLSMTTKRDEFIGWLDGGLTVQEACSVTGVTWHDLRRALAEDAAFAVAYYARRPRGRSEDDLSWLWPQLDTTHPCWIWHGPVNTYGYPRVVVGERSQELHRLVYAHEHGEIPVGSVVRHTCRVRRCLNPAHLVAAPRRSPYVFGERRAER